jgi:hypothetical protein
MWQRPDRRQIVCDFAVLGRVTSNSGRFMILDSSGGERLVAVICLTLTSKPRLTRPSEIFPQRCCAVGGVPPPLFAFRIWGRRSSMTDFGCQSRIWRTGNPPWFCWWHWFRFLCYGTRSFHLPHLSAALAVGLGRRQMLGLLGLAICLSPLFSHPIP